MLLDAKAMDRQTSRLRTLIGNLHNRNRVLERQEDLSPAHAEKRLRACLVSGSSTLIASATSSSVPADFPDVNICLPGSAASSDEL